MRRSSPLDPSPGWRAAAFVLLAGVLGIWLTPWLWALLSAFKPREEILSSGLWPSALRLTNFEELLRETLYLRWLLNSVIVSVSASALGMVVCAMGGHAFARFHFPGRTLLFWMVIAAVSIPPFTTVIPLFGWLARLGLLNTYPVLVLPFAASAFGLFMMRQYMTSIPDELVEAARIDGCGEFRLFWQIVLPLVRPALGTVGILIFLSSWNAFLWPLVFMRSEEMFTLPVGIAGLNSEQMAEYGQVMAAAILSCLPMLAVFFAMQRQLIAGLTAGAVKG